MLKRKEKNIKAPRFNMHLYKKLCMIFGATIAFAMMLISCRHKEIVDDAELQALLREYAAMQNDSTTKAKAVQQLTDVDLPNAQQGAANAFNVRASIPASSFENRVRGIDENGGQSMGYANAATDVIDSFGPNGTNQLENQAVVVLYSIKDASNAFTGFCDVIAGQRTKIQNEKTKK